MTKYQIPDTKEAPSFNETARDDWDIGFCVIGWNLELGIWSFTSTSHLLHRLIQRAVELVHRGLGFIAHAGKAEGRAFDLPVTAIDQESPVLHDLLQPGDIHHAATGLRAIIHAGKRERFIALLREKCETMLLRPFAGELRERGVAEEALFESFGENVLELGSERVHVADARCARRHILLRVLLELDEIKVISAILHFPGALQGGAGTGEHSQAGRKREGLLRAGQQN